MEYVDNLPVAKTLYAKRLSDNKEFFVYSMYVYKGSDVGGIKGIAKDGEESDLDDGTFRLYRR